MIKNFKIIIILCLITSVSRFVLDSYLPSLPAIAHYFNISNNHVQLTITLYLLGFSISQLFYGPLSDQFGRRRILIIGLSIFALSNFLCTFSHDAPVLILFRLFAGIGAGACGVLNRAIASDCFAGVEFTKAWSYTTTSLVLTLIFAPLLGGIMQEYFGWRSNFLLATAFVVAVLLTILKYLPETNHHIRQTLHPKKILSNYLQIISSKKFISCTFCYTLAFAGLIVYFQTSPLLYMNIYGMTPIQYGWSSVVIALSYLAGGKILRMLAHKVSSKRLLFVGNILLMAGGLSMFIINLFGGDDLPATLIPAAIYVLGARIVIPNAIAGSLEEFRHLGGSTSALIGAIQMFGSFLISLLMAHFDYNSNLPIAICFILLGSASIIMSLFICDKKIKTHHLGTATPAMRNI